MKQTLRLINYSVLILLTVAACAVMWQVSVRSKGNKLKKLVIPPLSEKIAPKQRVAIQRFEPKEWPLYSAFSGMIQPWETYHIGFELSGRIKVLGVNEKGQPLDEGDKVQAGQVMARMDDRVLVAQRDEASAEVELANTEYERARKIRKRGSTAITDMEFQKRQTAVATAGARLAIAKKNLDDAVLTSPIKGIISKRFLKVGEAVNPREVVFEIIEIDPILLKVNVPESEILGLQKRIRTLKKNAAAGATEQDFAIPALVYLQGTDRFGKPQKPIQGTLHQIAQVASLQTGLFEVEIKIDNKEHRFRPGLVATTWIETGRLYGYQLPTTTLISRQGVDQLFITKDESAEIQAMYWDVGTTFMHRIVGWNVEKFIDQRPLPNTSKTSGNSGKASLSTIIIPAEKNEVLNVVVRGQHRLTSGQLVRIVSEKQGSESATSKGTGETTPLLLSPDSITSKPSS